LIILTFLLYPTATLQNAVITWAGQLQSAAFMYFGLLLCGQRVRPSLIHRSIAFIVYYIITLRCCHYHH